MTRGAGTADRAVKKHSRKAATPSRGGRSVEMDTQPGEFTEIRFILPRAAPILP